MAVGERAEAAVDSSPARSSAGPKAGARSPSIGAAQVAGSALALELAQGSPQASPARKGSPAAAGVTHQVTERDGVPVLVPFDRTQLLLPPLPQAVRAPSLPIGHKAGGTWGGADPEAHFLKSVSCPGKLRGRPPTWQGPLGQFTGTEGGTSQGASSSTRERGTSNTAGACSPSFIGQETGGAVAAFPESSTSAGTADSSSRDTSASGASGSSDGGTASGGSTVYWDVATSSRNFCRQGSSSSSSGVVNLQGVRTRTSTNNNNKNNSSISGSGRPPAAAPKHPRLKRTASLDADEEDTRAGSEATLQPGQGSPLNPIASVPPGASRDPAHPANAHTHATSLSLSPVPGTARTPRLPHASRPPPLPRASSLNVQQLGGGKEPGGTFFMNLRTGAASTTRTGGRGMEAFRSRQAVEGVGMEAGNSGVISGTLSPGSLSQFHSMSLSTETEHDRVADGGSDKAYQSRGSDKSPIIRAFPAAGVSDLCSAGGQGARPEQDPLPQAASLAWQGEPASDSGTFFLNLSHPHMRRPRRGTVPGLVASPDRPLGKQHLARGSEASYTDSSAHPAMGRAKDLGKGGPLRTGSALIGELLERQGSLGDILRQQQQRGEMRREAGRCMLLGSASLSGKQGRSLGRAADGALLWEDPEPWLWHGPLSHEGNPPESSLNEAGPVGGSKHLTGPLVDGGTGRQPDTTETLTGLGLRLDLQGDSVWETHGSAGGMGAVDDPTILADVPCGVHLRGQPELSPGEAAAAVQEPEKGVVSGSDKEIGEGGVVQGGDAGAGSESMPRILSVDSGSSQELSKSLQACPGPRGVLRSQSMGSSFVDRAPLKSALKTTSAERESAAGSCQQASTRKQVHFSGFVEVRQVIRVEWHAQVDQGQA